VIRALGLDYVTPDGQKRVFELTVSPGARGRYQPDGLDLRAHGQRLKLPASGRTRRCGGKFPRKWALGLRNSLTTIAGYAQQLASSRDPELARQLADDVANEAARLDRTIGSFLAGSKAAAAGS